MKQKTLNVICAITQGIALLMLLFGKIATYVEREHYMNGSYFSGSQGDIYFSNMLEGNPIFGLIVVGLMFAGIIMCAISACSKTGHRDSALHSALPIVNFAFFLFFVAVGTQNAEDCYSDLLFTDIERQPIVSIIYILLFISIVLGFVKRSKIVAPIEKTNPTTSPQPARSDAEELKKYKELLDSGVITQEEFEAKKKQLLGL